MASELSDLVDILTQHGISTAAIRIEIVKAVKDAYSLWTHQPIDDDVEIFLDYYAGNIAVHKSGQDVTPPEFKEFAISTVRKTLVKMLDNTISTDSKNTTPPERSPIFLKWIFNFIFWFYNGIYVLFATIFTFSILKNDQMSEIVDSFSDLNYFQSFELAVLLTAPLLTILFAVNSKRYKSTKKLAKIFFFFEIPVVVTCLLMFASFGQTIPAVSLIVTTIILTPFVWLAHTLNIHSENKKIQLAEMVFKTIVFTATTYIGLIVAFYIPLLLAYLGNLILEVVSKIFDSILSLSGIIQFIPYSIELLLGAILVISVAAFVMLPYVVAALTWRSIKNTSKILSNTYKKRTLLIINAATSIIFLLVLFFGITHKENNLLVEYMRDIKDKTTFEDRAAIAKILIPQKESVAQNIKEAQSIQSRYIYTKQDHSLKSQYQSTFNNESFVFDLIQETFDFVAFPITYQGPKINYFDLSDLNFKYVFGTDINQYKYPEPKNVTLNSRKVTIEPFANKLFATVTVEEEYQNTGFSNQEIIYEFSLSDDSVITDLKLGPQLEFDGIVAPRGAALQTYQRELQQRRDPALLEETGPRQYRLRVFPIPSKNDFTTLKGRNQKVQFSYITAISPSGYSLPVYTKEQNINITSLTRFEGTIDQNIFKLDDTTTTAQFDGAPQTICGSSDDLTINSASVSAKLVKSSSVCDSIAQNKTKTAILYDVSASRKGTSQYRELQTRLDQYFQNVDIYYFNDLLSQPLVYSPQTKLPDPIYFGTTPTLALVNNLQNRYENIIIMTSKDFNLDTSTNTDIKTGVGNIYIVYDQGKIPALQQDVARKLMQSNVALSSSLLETVQIIGNKNIATQLSQNIYSVSPTWRLVALPKNSQTLQSDSRLNSFLAKKFIDYSIARSSGSVELNLTIAQPLHEIAQQYKVVTLLSSIIALVNDQQKQNLAYDSLRYDKFNQGTTVQNNPQITLPQNSRFGFNSAPTIGSMNMSGSTQSGSYGFPSTGASISSIINLFIFANLAMIVFSGITAALYFYKQKKKQLTKNQ